MGLENIVLGFFEFVGSIDFSFFSSLLIMVVLLFWLVIIGWVWVDSGERTSKMGLRVMYLFLVVFLNIPGLIIYLIVRPSETIEEIYWADLERRYLKYETSDLGDCSKCGEQLYPGYVFCTNCGNEIKRRCPKCGVIINKDHKYCEYCGIQVRERAAIAEQYPNVSVMEQQIQALREHATETVESKRTRYKTGKSLVVKLGDAILVLFSQLKELITDRISFEQINQGNGQTEDDSKRKETFKEQSRKKKKKKKKKKR